MADKTKFNPVEIYETPGDRFKKTGNAVALAKDTVSRTYSLAVINGGPPHYGYTVLSREDLADLRDALNRELAS